MYAPLRKAFGLFVAAIGFAVALAGFAYDYRLSKTSPHHPVPADRLVVLEGRGTPHYFVTVEDDQLVERSFGLGFIVFCSGLAILGAGPRKSRDPKVASNQSSDPAFASGTSRAGHEPRHR
jgi:hypothetical protein